MLKSDYYRLHKGTCLKKMKSIETWQNNAAEITKAEFLMSVAEFTAQA